MKTPSQAEYETNEARLLQKQLDAVRLAPLADRQAARVEMSEAMANEPKLVADRVGWIINGSYGWGACRKAKTIISGRGNKPAALVQLVAALEWGCPDNFTREAWGGLTKPQQDALNALVLAEIVSTECAIA